MTATSDERSRSKEFATELTNERALLDDLDGRILRTLGRSWEDSTTSLARALGQPASTIAYHLKNYAVSGLFSAHDISSIYSR